MKDTRHSTHGQHLRRDARALGGKVCVAGSRMAMTAVQATLFTAKINPRWVSGGLPREGNP